MMFIDFLISVFKENKENEGIVWKDKVFTYEWLLERNKYWNERGNWKPGRWSNAKDNPSGYWTFTFWSYRFRGNCERNPL